MNNVPVLPLQPIATLFVAFCYIYGFFSLSLIIYGVVLILLRPKIKVEISGISPERRRLLRNSSLILIMVLKIMLILIAIVSVPTSLGLHIFLGLDLAWLFIFWGLILVNLVLILIQRIWLARQLADEPSPPAVSSAAVK